MRSGQFLKQLRDLNQHLYTNNFGDFGDWKLLDKYLDNTGVVVGLFDSGRDIIFCVMGTDGFRLDLRDINADRAMIEGKVPAQYNSAEKYFNTLKYDNIIFTGYSLGGSICQLLGSKYGNETITFEAYGMADRKQGSNTSNIVNFGNLKDPVFLNTIENQIGRVEIMEVSPNLKVSGMYHLYPFYGSPDKLIDWDGTIPEHGSFPNTTNLTNRIKPVYYKGKDIGNKVHNKLNDVVTNAKSHLPKNK